jgi:hypothetical protein
MSNPKLDPCPYCSGSVERNVSNNAFGTPETWVSCGFCGYVSAETPDCVDRHNAIARKVRAYDGLAAACLILTPDRLRLLADWFDKRDRSLDADLTPKALFPTTISDEVQTDLRHAADLINAAFAGLAAPDHAPAPLLTARTRIVIEVRGGIVQEVYADNPAALDITIRDHDNDEIDRDAELDARPLAELAEEEGTPS